MPFAIAAVALAAALPRPSLTSAPDNAAYAVAAICAPFVLDGVEAERLPLEGSLVHGDGYKAPIFQGQGLTPVRVGFAGFVHVGVGVVRGRRDCEITTGEGDPQALRRVMLDALASRPEGFVPAKSRYLPGRSFATEDWVCASPESRNPTALVLLSATPTEGRRVLFTLSAGGERDASCDRDDVRLNYRTLIPPAPPR